MQPTTPPEGWMASAYRTLVKHPDVVMPLDPMATVFRLIQIGMRDDLCKVGLDNYRIEIQPYQPVGTGAGLWERLASVVDSTMTRTLKWQKGENLANLAPALDNFCRQYQPEKNEPIAEILRAARPGLERLQQTYRTDQTVRAVLLPSFLIIDGALGLGSSPPSLSSLSAPRMGTGAASLPATALEPTDTSARSRSSDGAEKADHEALPPDSEQTGALVLPSDGGSKNESASSGDIASSDARTSRDRATEAASSMSGPAGPIAHDLKGYAPWAPEEITICLRLVRFANEKREPSNLHQREWTHCTSEALEQLLMMKDAQFQQHCERNDIAIEYHT